MFWVLVSRPLTVMLTLAGVAILSPVLVPLASAIIRPLIKPVANLYLDLAEEIGEVVEEREQLKARQEKIVRKRVQDKEAKKIQEGTEVLDEVGKLL